MDISPLLDWIAAHPELAWAFVFLVALGESLAIVGLVVPGAALMVGFGALIASETIALVPTLIAAFLGAVAGDALSFWLGRAMEHRAHHHWPFSRHPQLIAQGEAFFRKHGGLSVFLGRFFGPLRPIIPLVAGLMDMPWPRFLLVNVLSAALWAPAYLLPGLALGTTFEALLERWDSPWVVGGVLVVVLMVFWWARKRWNQPD